MTRNKGSTKPDARFEQLVISTISVSGYKSIAEEQEIEVRPLTILAGANSSGKSSLMQPVLLLKQTLESIYDPGPLLLNGPNVRLTSLDQALSRVGKSGMSRSFSVSLMVGPERRVTLRYGKHDQEGVEVQEMVSTEPTGFGDLETVRLRPGLPSEEIRAELGPSDLAFEEGIADSRSKEASWWRVVRNRCFLTAELRVKRGGYVNHVYQSKNATADYALVHLLKLIHVPGLRGNPERSYPVAATGSYFPATFEPYVASVIAKWQREKQDDVLETLSRQLSLLGLTWKAIAVPISDTQVEIRVGRLPRPAEEERAIL